MFSIVWKLIILYLCESNIEFYMRVKEIPILLLTGYLGSGKTTLVNHILSNKRGIKFAVIVNDIGEVNIDADLIQRGGIVGKKDESLVALQNGCICCTLKMDLVEQIDDIMKQERFDYIVIEASDDRFCGGVAVMYPVVVEGFGKIDDISPPPIRSVSRTASRRNNGIGCNCRPQGAHCAAPVPFLRCRWCSSGRENGRGRNGCRIGSVCVWDI